MQFTEIIAAYSKNSMEHINTVCVQNADLYILVQMVHIVIIVLQRAKREKKYA